MSNRKTADKKVKGKTDKLKYEVAQEMGLDSKDEMSKPKEE